MNNIINHPYTSYGLIGSLLVGVGLLVGGAIFGHYASVIVCATGGVFIAGSLVGGAVKINNYIQGSKEEKDEHPEAAYIPASTNPADWDALRAKNPNVKVASNTITSDDPDTRANVTVDSLARLESVVHRYTPHHEF